VSVDKGAQDLGLLMHSFDPDVSSLEMFLKRVRSTGGPINATIAGLQSISSGLENVTRLGAMYQAQHNGFRWWKIYTNKLDAYLDKTVYNWRHGKDTEDDGIAVNGGMTVAGLGITLKKAREISRAAEMQARPGFERSPSKPWLERAVSFEASEHITPMEAASAFAESTLNFARGGDAVYRDMDSDQVKRSSKTGRNVNRHYVFFNPAVQDLWKTTELMGQSPMATAVLATVSIILPQLLLSWYNSDDEDYRKLTPYDRYAYWNIGRKASEKMGIKFGESLRIPKPQGPLGRQLAWMTEEFMYAPMEADNGFIESMKRPQFWEYALEDFPVLGSFLSDLSPENRSNMARNMLINASPSGAQPIVEMYLGWDSFKRRSIVPTYEELLPGSQSYKGKKATQLARFVASAPGMPDVNPYHVDHFLNSYFTNVGQDLQRLFSSAGGGVAMEQAAESWGRDVPKDQYGGGEVPRGKIANLAFHLGMIAKAPLGQGSKPVNDFYRTLQQLNAANADMKEVKKNRDKYEVGGGSWTTRNKNISKIVREAGYVVDLGGGKYMDMYKYGNESKAAIDKIVKQKKQVVRAFEAEKITPEKFYGLTYRMNREISDVALDFMMMFNPEYSYFVAPNDSNVQSFQDLIGLRKQNEQPTGPNYMQPMTPFGGRRDDYE